MLGTYRCPTLTTRNWLWPCPPQPILCELPACSLSLSVWPGPQCFSPLWSLALFSLSVFLQSLPCLLPISLFLFSSLPVPVFLSLSLCFLSDIRFVCLTRPHNNACAEFPGPGLVMVMAKSWEGPGLWDATYLEQGWAILCGRLCLRGSEKASPESPLRLGLTPPGRLWG